MLDRCGSKWICPQTFRRCLVPNLIKIHWHFSQLYSVCIDSFPPLRCIPEKCVRIEVYVFPSSLWFSLVCWVKCLNVWCGVQKLERVARAVRGNDRPFGGLQLILCGDFLQLPPVTKETDQKDVRFCFQSAAWERCVHVSFELTQVHRQSDPVFIEILQNVRIGRWCTFFLICVKHKFGKLTSFHGEVWT